MHKKREEKGREEKRREEKKRTRREFDFPSTNFILPDQLFEKVGGTSSFRC